MREYLSLFSEITAPLISNSGFELVIKPLNSDGRKVVAFERNIGGWRRDRIQIVACSESGRHIEIGALVYIKTSFGEYLIATCPPRFLNKKQQKWPLLPSLFQKRIKEDISDACSGVLEWYRKFESKDLCITSMLDDELRGNAKIGPDSPASNAIKAVLTSP